MADLIRFSVPGKPEYVGVVRLAISSAASAAGFDVEDVEDIKIAVSEVCTNIFCCGDHGIITYKVSCEVGENGITISIDDMSDDDDQEINDLHECQNFPVNNIIDDLFDPSMSILMLRVLMDEVSIFAGCNENMLIRMIKHL